MSTPAGPDYVAAAVVVGAVLGFFLLLIAIRGRRTRL